MEEMWKDINGYEGKYQVSNLGRVKSLDRLTEWKSKMILRKGKILKPRLNKNGYRQVCLHNNGKQKTYRVHRLVWEAFNGKVPEGYEVNHISECKTDNRLSNLNLLSHKANMRWGTGIERRVKANTNHPNKSKSVIQKSLDGKVIKVWASTHEVQRALGYANQHISNCCRGGYFDKRYNKWINYNQSHGFIWKYEKATA